MRKRVLVATPQFGVSPPEGQEFRSGVALHLGRWMAQPDCPYEFSIGIVPDMLVQFSRETICKQAVADGFDYVCMVDDDMDGPHDLWDRLLAHDVDVASPLAFMRQPPHFPVVYAERGGWIPDSPYHHVNNGVVRNYPRDKLFECDAVGFGAVCIKVDVLKRLKAPWFFTMWGTKGTGEDIWFCLRARREAGARIFCDSRIKLKHLGPRVWIGEEDYLRLNPEVKELYEAVGEWTQEKSRNNLMV